ncbi:type I-E CRISPR-associated protein Cse2/CasB [Pluralibacter gergoviae]|uniref:type I-E CRISPR-associated protein Cse2/CasB n=1 Tax=Pluralibacter gergoviae TaxID=61647 RepID=UPI000BFBF052|nr:type I-E CRISPR-associated protein Cse2/CasB [Pluralibacter gergoviae]ELO7477928.1 type I-E CRISPR-associated protein Cse2/CasB [Pluralibacter gergoviae]ELW9439717.1 type I-E CRISPR-associated protein Cse2/CasB [Pluralibacter gergoviae]MCK1067623.1 type I-E CRISPR-associated protein Cse2/CasB [Pluralibacter gergoviae]MCV7757305.1 type I-E CRISPR-associated protein Cse2/CasB [Pluralibacter gergoviae]PHH46047.1 type I-E CRISPR-associated protein Cse2/CasB [Pluralibacter gergoviae]
MVNSDTKKPLYLKTPESQSELLAWFEILSERKLTSGGVNINGRVWRAELKRAEPPYGTMLCESYNDLCRRLTALKECKEIEDIYHMALSLFSCVAGHIQHHNPEGSFAAQLGEKLKGDKPCILKLRFERLLKARSPEDLCRQLIQVVRIRGKEGCNVISLADSLFIWMKEWRAREKYEPESSDPFTRNRIRWANEYFSTSR